MFNHRLINPLKTQHLAPASQLQGAPHTVTMVSVVFVATLLLSLKACLPHQDVLISRVLFFLFPVAFWVDKD